MCWGMEGTKMLGARGVSGFGGKKRGMRRAGVWPRFILNEGGFVLFKVLGLLKGLNGL